ncbi:MAG: DinB family protein, partial [Chloroflexota bacterium]
GRLDDLWTDVLDKPPTQKSYGGAIGHVITHDMHHRAEVLHIMARLGMSDLPEGDLMGWDQRTRLS